MPATEPNPKTMRYRQHRIELTKWSTNDSLPAKYAFFAELVLLWLDCAAEQEEKVWTMVLFYMGGNKRTKDLKDELDSPAGKTKEKMKGYLDAFLSDETVA